MEQEIKEEILNVISDIKTLRCWRAADTTVDKALEDLKLLVEKNTDIAIKLLKEAGDNCNWYMKYNELENYNVQPKECVMYLELIINGKVGE